jgi:energy-converting hydrogenase Eha subunit A
MMGVGRPAAPSDANKVSMAFTTPVTAAGVDVVGETVVVIKQKLL